MSAHRLRAGLLVLCLCTAVLPAAARAQTPESTPRIDEAGYRAALEAARGLSKSQAWKKAKDAWLEIVRGHAGAAYVRGELEEIRLELRRASFWSGARAPKLDDLLSGDLLSYDPGTGWLKIRYTGFDLRDFETASVDGLATYAHPAHFKGPWAINLEGTPQELASANWLVAVGESGLGVKFGSHEENDLIYYKHVLFEYDKQGNQELAVFDPKPRKSKSKTVEAEIRVEARSLRASYAGAKVLETTRERDDFGQLIIVTPKAFGELTISGKVDSGWLDGVMDSAVADQRHTFDVTWKDPAEFGAWNGSPAPAREEIGLQELLNGVKFMIPVSAEQEKLVDLFTGAFAKGRRHCLAALAELEQLRENSFPAEALVYLDFMAAMSLGRYSRALEHFAAMKPDEGQERDSALLHAVLLGLARRHADAAVRLEALAVAHPELAAAQLRLVETLLRLGRVAAARNAIARARDALPSSPGLAELELKVVKSELGPPWKKVFEYEGRYFSVRSDVGAKLCRDAVRVLDKAMERCIFEFGPVGEAGYGRTIAYLFAGEASYRDYVKGIADDSVENTLGIYSLLLKQVAAWNQPDPERLWDTLRHECLHRYVDLRIGEVPRWFGEGLAETFAASAQSGETWKNGGLRPGWIESFRGAAQTVPDLETMARQEDDAFLVDVERNYALAWTWVHYLRFQNEESRGIFAALWAALADGADLSVAVDRALEHRDLKAVNADFLSFFDKLRRG